MTSTELTSTSTDGSADFDFIFGTWQVRNHKLRDATDPECTEWLEFDTTAHAEPILGGLGNVDRVWAKAAGDAAAWEGFTLRQFDPVAQVWRIWWTSTKAVGFLDPPLEGRFVDGAGEFSCDDVIAGRAVKVRFDWTQPTPQTARWAQSFSWHGGANWQLNWVMDFARPAGAIFAPSLWS